MIPWWDLPEHGLEQEETRTEAVVQSTEMVAPLASHNSGNQSKLCIQN